MIQKDKNLLLVDLCARLPYDVMCHANEINLDGELLFINKVYNIVALYNDKAVGKFDTCPIADVKPYLRPMSSMTEEEKDELWFIGDNDFGAVREWYKKESIKETGTPCPVTCGKVDYCNKNHFDYRVLIEKGLALEAPEGMYKTK